MGRFSKNKLAGSSELNDIQSSITTIEGEVENLGDEINAKATSAEIAEVADDLLVTNGRKLLLEPTNVTGSGGTGTEVDKFSALTMPAGFTPVNGSKYRIGGTILARSTMGERYAEIGVRDLVVMRSAAINSWSGSPGTYTPGQVVLHNVDEGGAVIVQHWFMALQATTSSNEPVFGGNSYWQDMGASTLVAGVAYWGEVKPADVTINTHGGAATVFGDEANLPEVDYNPATGALAIRCKPVHGQQVRLEFDGSIASIGFN